MDMRETRISGEYFFEGRIMKARVDEVRLPNGKQASREVCEHVGGVGVLPIDRDGNIILVRQFRYPFDTETLEMPAGKMDVKDLIRSENKDTQQNIEKAQKSLENNDNQIYSLLNNVDKMLIKEIERSKYKYENLTDEQRSIKNYVESINNLMKEVERLQTLSVEQQKQILELQSELNQAQHFNNNFTQHM